MANQAANCDSQFGGRVAFTIGGQKFKAADADVRIEVSNITVDAEMNSDGTLCRKVKLKPYKMEVTFRQNSSVVWQSNMMACSVDATAVEEDNGRTHLMTGAIFTGTPSYNLSTGELTGVTLEGGSYQMT
jgi:Phage tail tube protein